MKILLVGNAPTVKGGITSVISEIRSYDWKSEGVNLKFIPTYNGGNSLYKILYFILAYIRIFFALIFFRPNVVYMHMSYKGSFNRKYAIHKLCKFFKVKDIIHLHGSMFADWFNGIDDKKKNNVRTLMRESCYFIVLGEKWNQFVKDVEPRTNTIVLNNSVAIPKETVSWNNESFNILFLGVLIERKGVADLLEAIKNILSQRDGKNIPVKVTIAGTGEEEERLKALCKELQIESVVSFAGWIDGEKKKELILQSQLLVLPSYNEGLPMAILEAMSYGLPVVATDVGDISSAVYNGKNGYLIKPGDIEALAEAISKIANSRMLYDEMSEYSRKLAETKFSVGIYFAKLEAIYKSV